MTTAQKNERTVKQIFTIEACNNPEQEASIVRFQDGTTGKISFAVPTPDAIDNEG
jgi:hypothetical protein